VTLRARFAAAAICIAAPMAVAQASPEATIARFIKLANAGELTTADGQAILTGEAKQFATDARSALPGADKVIVVNPALAVARIVLRGGAGQEADAYFYLEKTAAGWAVSSYRAMALSGMDQMLLAEMKKRPTLSPKEQLEKLNLELTLSSDSQLRAWFSANHEKLDLLTVAFLLFDHPGQNKVDPGIVADLKQLGLSAIEEAEGEVRVVIGGTLDNTVGFLKPGPAGPPVISPSEYIWLENVGNGWFLFRTT
jgi:hypothetical protein